ALVAMPLNRSAHIRIGQEPASLRGERRLGRIIEQIFVGPEINGVRTRLGDEVGLLRRQFGKLDVARGDRLAARANLLGWRHFCWRRLAPDAASPGEGDDGRAEDQGLAPFSRLGVFGNWLWGGTQRGGSPSWGVGFRGAAPPSIGRAYSVAPPRARRLNM